MAKTSKPAGTIHNSGRKPLGGCISSRVTICLSPQEQQFISKLSVVKTAYGPMRITAAEVFRMLLRNARESRGVRS